MTGEQTGEYVADVLTDRWRDDLPPKGCLLDEFGRLWRFTYMQEWKSEKRQYTCVPLLGECGGQMKAEGFCPHGIPAGVGCSGDEAHIGSSAREETP